MSERRKTRSTLVATVDDFRARLVVWVRKGSQWKAAESRTIDFVHGERILPVEDRPPLIDEAVKSLKVKAQYSVLVLPKKSVTLNMVTLPATEEDEIVKMVRFEAERLIPFNADRYIISHHVVEHLGIEGSRILVGAVDGHVLTSLLAMFEEAGVRFQQAIISSQALFNALPSEEMIKNEHSSMIVHIGSHTTDLVLTESGQLRFARSIGMGWKTLTQQIVSSYDLKEEIDRDFFSRLDALSPDLDSKLQGEGGKSKKAGEQAGAGRGPDAASQPPGVDAESVAPVAEASGRDTLETHTLDNGSSLIFHKTLEEEQDGAAEGAASGDQDAEVATFGIDAESPPADGPAVKSPALEVEKDEVIGQWLSRIVMEVRRTWEFATRESEYQPLKHLYMSGLAASWMNFGRYIEVNLGCESHELSRSWEAFSIDVDQLKEDRPDIWNMEAGGLIQAVSERPLSINLLPVDYLKKQVVQEQYKSWSVVGLLVVVAALAVFMAYQKMEDVRLQEYNGYRNLNDEMQLRAEQLLDEKTKLSLLESHIFDKQSAMQILDLINKFETIPDRVTLTNFDYTRNKDLVIRGHAKEIDDVNAFRGELLATGLFEFVEVVNYQPKPLPGRKTRIYDYQLKCLFPVQEGEQQ